MATVSIRQRAVIALVGYGVLALFALVFVLLRRNTPTLTTTHVLILSAVSVAPLVLALLWEHLKGVKLGQVEISLNEVAPTPNVELAAEIQKLEASVTPALSAAMRAAVGNRGFRLVEINLRSAPYWWSTRLYLLAALAEEYTNVERLVFLEQEAARLFVGMAPPTAVRKALAKKFPDLQRVFRKVQQDVTENFRPPDDATEVESIINQWSTQPLFTSIVEGQVTLTVESNVKQLTAAANLREWLPNSLETESRQWSGESHSSSLYAKILSCTVPYVPLLNGQRLEKVVNRGDLAMKLADSAVS
jgi:hypothetical protein